MGAGRLRSIRRLLLVSANFLSRSLIGLVGPASSPDPSFGNRPRSDQSVSHELEAVRQEAGIIAPELCSVSASIGACI